MKFEIYFPDQPADEARVLAQELRLALLRNGADPSKVEIVKERADAMDLGSVVEIVIGTLTVTHIAQSLYGICVPTKPRIRIKTPRGSVLDLGPSELSFNRLKQILDALDSDENSD